MSSSSYSTPEVLCETDWVADNLKNQRSEFLKSITTLKTHIDRDISGAYLVWWKKDINDSNRRDIINKRQFEALMSRVGVPLKQNLSCMATLITGLPLLHYGYFCIMVTREL